MTWIKICGITQEEELEYLKEAGVDYAGFVQFYPKSKRNIPIQRAKELMSYLGPDIRPVAVTVSPNAEQLRQIEESGFSAVQIHGDIPDEVLDSVRLPVWKAFNVRDLTRFKEYEARENVTAYVFDAQVPGSGQAFDWTLLKQLPRTEKMTWLAGGLHPLNVAEALRSTVVDGVDTSSGVENEDGIGKSREKIQEFVRAVRGCLQ